MTHLTRPEAVLREALRQALIEGEQSGDPVPFSMRDIIEEAQRESSSRLDSFQSLKERP